MRLYHRTYHHEAILEHGFRDAEGTYLTTEKHSGVWVSDRPLNGNEGAEGDVVLAIEVPERDIAPFEAQPLPDSRDRLRLDAWRRSCSPSARTARAQAGMEARRPALA